MRHLADALAFFCDAVRATLPITDFVKQLQVKCAGVSWQRREGFDQQVGSPATKLRKFLP